MRRSTLGLFTALTLISGTAQASPYAHAAATPALTAPGYATPGEPPPAATPAPEPYAGEPAAGPQPYTQPYAEPGPVYGPQPGPAPYQPPPPPPRRRGKGMMIGGFITFGAGYLTTALVGAAALDSAKVSDAITENDPNRRSRRLGGSLLVPVLGPLIAIPHIESATGTMFAVFSFVAQAGGLGLGIAGAVRYARDGRSAQAAQAGLHLGRGVRLRALPRLGGGALHLTYRF